MLSPSAVSRRITKWVNLKSLISSVSCTNSIQYYPETDQTTPNTTDFEAKIQFLRNNLYPDDLIKVLNSACDINSAVKIFKWAALQRQFRHTAETYYWIILKLGMAGDVMEMEGFCQNMIRDVCPGGEDALLSLIELFIGHSRLYEAVRVLANLCLGGYKPSIEFLNFVLGALVEEKRGLQDVVFVYKEIIKAGVLPTVVTLNYLLEVLFQTGKVVLALDQYQRMNKKGCNPNSRTFEIVVRGLIANNQVDDAISILNDMLEVGCQPELSFYICTIPLFCEENKLEEGMRLFRVMRELSKVPDPLIYEALIRCLCKNLLLDDAVNLLEEMLESDLTPASDVFVAVVNGYCRMEKLNEAMKFLEDKNVSETSPYNELLLGLCSAGKFSIAVGLLEKMSERDIADCDSWNVLVRWLCEKAEVRRGYEVVGRMIISSLVPESSTYSALVLGNCRLRKYEVAEQLFLLIRAKCWILDSVSYTELVEGLCRVEKYLEAAEVFQYMSENGCSLQSSSVDRLIKGICDRGMVNEAVKLQFLAYNSGTSCANSSRSHIMFGLSKTKEARYLLVFLSQMLIQGYNLDTDAYCILIRSMIAQNRTKNCAFFFIRMLTEGFLPDSGTLYNLLSYLANRCQLYLISGAIDKLVSNRELLHPGMFNVLVNGLWKEGNKMEARRLLDLMLEKGWVPDSSTHRLLIGSVGTEEVGEEKLACEALTIEDHVSDILAEGLGKTRM